MRIGTYFFLQAPPGHSGPEIVAEEVEQMVLSERLGFDSVWLTEHHYADYGLSSAPSVLAATVAARTQRITIGLAVYVLPFHHPLRLAEETAMLDILSHGRLVVGIGRGNRPIEFVGHGVKQDDSRERLEEGVEILLQAWTQERVSFHGRQWQIDNIPVYPKPLTQPHPPLAFAATSQATISWAAQHGFRLLSSGLSNPLPTIVNTRDTYVSALRAAGFDEPRVQQLLSQWVVSKHVYVAETDAQARADAEGPERWYLDSFARSIRPDGLSGLSESVRSAATAMADRQASLRWEDLVEESLLIGSPATVRRKLAELESAGVGEVLCWMNFGGIPTHQVRRSMRLFADEVLPAVRRSATTAAAPA